VARYLHTPLTLLLLTALLAGCGVGARSPEPVYHVLAPRAQNLTQALTGTIGVGPVRVAPFLLNQRIVVHGGGSQLQQRDGERWAEPLDNGIQRVVLQNLSTLTGAKMRNFPWRQRGTPHYAVRLDVLDLDRLPDGRAALEVIWMVEDMRKGRLARSLRERFTVPAGGGDTAALVEAYNQLLLQLAERVARALAAEQARTTTAEP
jgi:uncharacterized lipoprotein YmbA